MRGFAWVLLGWIAVGGGIREAAGQGYCRAPTYATQRYTNSYYTPTYSAPTYAPTYYPQTINYPVVVGVPLSSLGIDYYYSVPPEKRESRIVEKVASEILGRMNQNEYGLLVPIQKQNPSVVPEPGEVGSPVVPETPTKAPPELPTKGSPLAPSPSTPEVGAVPPPPEPLVGDIPPPTPVPPISPPIETPIPNHLASLGGMTSPEKERLQIALLMRSRCVQCHKPGEIKNGVKLFNSDGSVADHPLNTRIDIVNSVLRKEGANPMPPKQSLSVIEQKRMVHWLLEKM